MVAIPSSSSQIYEETATGTQIHAIVTDLEPHLWAYPRSHCIIALLSMTAALMNPDAAPEEVQEVVKGASQWMCLYFAVRGVDGEKVKEVLN